MVVVVVAAAVVATGSRCSRQCALIVAKTLKYRSNPAMADRYIAAAATPKSEQISNTELEKSNTGWGFPSLCLF